MNLHLQINIPFRQLHPHSVQTSKTTLLLRYVLSQKLNLVMHLRLIHLQPKIIVTYYNSNLFIFTMPN